MSSDTALDYLLYGITTCYNYTLALGYPDRVLSEEFKASVDSGQRFIFAYPLAVNATKTRETALAEFEQFHAGVQVYKDHPLYLRLSLGTAGLQASEENARFFKGVADTEVMFRVLQGQGRTEPPSRVRPDVPRALDEIVVRGLQRNTADRFETALAMASALGASSLNIAGSRLGIAR